MLTAALLALSPATALADGAGDDQYQDPLVAPTTTQPKAQTNTTTTPAPTSTPSSTVAATQTTAPSSASSELPRTGAPAGLIGLAGVTLIAAGTALRRRTAQL